MGTEEKTNPTITHHQGDIIVEKSHHPSGALQKVSLCSDVPINWLDLAEYWMWPCLESGSWLTRFSSEFAIWSQEAWASPVDMQRHIRDGLAVKFRWGASLATSESLKCTLVYPS